MPGNPPRWLQALFWASLPSVLLAEMLPTIEPEEACEEFASPAAPLPWTLEDCIEVWNSWSGVQLPGLTSGYSDVDVFGATAEGLRRRGEPCVVQLTVDSDGAGSTSMRQLGAWMYAQEMGCTWITPYLKDLRFNKRNSETTVYCHPTATLAELDKDVKTPVVERVRRCEYVSWLEYFRFDLPSLPLTEGVKYNNIKVDSLNPKPLQSLVDDINAIGLENLPEGYGVRLYMHPSMASRYEISTGSWNSHKRAVARSVLEQMRTNFHRFPRPRAYLNTNDTYFEYLDAFMGKVTAAVEGKGQPAPVYHVFSQTIKPCPEPFTRAFTEFPEWEIDPAEVERCVNHEKNTQAPDDCPEKHAGFDHCRPDRLEIFHVRGRAIILHLGISVAHNLSCLIHADAILLGCSTFGHIAGVLTNGISLFSKACDGEYTPAQYRMVPPLAISELGHMWVPVNGSWRDPVLTADSIFDAALNHLLRAKGF